MGTFAGMRIVQKHLGAESDQENFIGRIHENLVNSLRE